MSFAFYISTVELSDGTVLRPPQDGMTIFFGPNNGGKTVLLQELAANLKSQGGVQVPKWVTNLQVMGEGTGEELLADLRRRGYQPRTAPYGVMYPGSPSQANSGGAQAKDLALTWEHKQYFHLPHLTIHQTAADRLNNHAQTQRLTGMHVANHPTQQLAANREQHEAFSKMVEHAFGHKIAINRYADDLTLLLGETGLPDEIYPVSDSLLNAYASLSTVAEQGHGFQAFVNLLLETLVRPAPVTIVDEPEAFLHPPQARLLGRYLASRVPSGSQVFIATHSSDFLAGVLEAAADRPVSLVRLANDGGTHTAKVLPPEAVSDLLNTPLLRYSNIISGLFHDGVVLCEAESDCQFYAATLDQVRGPDVPHGNLVFLHVNGKPRLADTADRLRQCGLPAVVIADLDLIRDPGQFRAAITRLGGDWSTVSADAEQVNAHANSIGITASAQKTRDEINRIIGSPRAGQVLTTDQVEEISRLLKASNGWTVIKQSGLAALNNQAAYPAMERLIKYCAGLGLFLVPVGELEGWVPSVPSGNKKAWFNRVFSEGLWCNPSPQLSEFIERVVSEATKAA